VNGSLERGQRPCRMHRGGICCRIARAVLPQTVVPPQNDVNVGIVELGALVSGSVCACLWYFKGPFSAPNTDDYGAPSRKAIASVIAGASLGFEPVAVRSSPVRVRVPRRSQYVCI
jgi:hypothetical protein